LISELVYLLTKSKKARVCSHIKSIFNPKHNNPKLLNKYPSISKLWDEINENEIKKESKSKLIFDCEMFKKYYSQKNILCIYYAFQIDLSEDKLKTKICNSTKPVWFIFSQLDGECKSPFVSWYKNHIGKMKEGFLCWLFPLIKHLGIISEGESVDISNTRSDKDYVDNWDKNRRNIQIELDDYVLDRHTKVGRNKGSVEFAIIGAYVDNEFNFVNLLWKKFYEDSKRFEEGETIIGEESVTHKEEIKKSFKKVISDDSDTESEIKKSFKKVISDDSDTESEIKKSFKKAISDDSDTESEIKKSFKKVISDDSDEKNLLETNEYNFIVLTQITTGSHKMDVYFAKDNNGKLVVVKGPYSNKKQIDIIMRNTEWKKQNNLPYVPFKVAKMIPDRWPDGIPLGSRNSIDRTKASWFIVYDSLINEDDIRIKIHSSKMWPETRVVDWDKIPFHFEYKSGKRTSQEIIDYTQAILFRYIRGISDYADRNFLLYKGRVLSIDEDIENKTVNIYSELRKNKAEYLYNWIKKNYDKLNIENWEDLYSSDKYEKKRLIVVKNKDKVLKLFKDV
jgi:hypothetical protein